MIYKRRFVLQKFCLVTECNLFDREQQSCVEIADKQIFVYGLSYEHPEIRTPLYDEWKPQNKPGFHVLLAHGGEVGYCPMDFTRLAAAMDLIYSARAFS